MIAVSLQRNSLAHLLIPVLVGSVALAVAIVGSVLIGDDRGGDGVNSFVEALSGDSSGFFGGLGIIGPLGFAFAAGVAAAFNPCGFAMLPAYMGLYLGTSDEDGQEPSLLSGLGKATLIGGAVTAGFVVLFGAAGTIIGLGARSIVADILPWLGLGIGVVLIIAGAWLVAGGKLYTALAQRAATHMGDPGQTNVKGYFMFGLSYGTASLSCTLPIFLSVIGTSFAVSSLGTSFGQFVLYAVGMGTVMMALTLGMALFRGGMVGALRKALPYIQPVGTWMMVLAGSYIVFYWLTIGGLF
ncbi:MAG: cytochrome c biogenesis protein CcdA [Chloroflexi bacterium]|nr:cytochrome c biogenesis protein CcdA [Chloroflexota bacterium]